MVKMTMMAMNFESCYLLFSMCLLEPASKLNLAVVVVVVAAAVAVVAAAVAVAVVAVAVVLCR